MSHLQTEFADMPPEGATLGEAAAQAARHLTRPSLAPVRLAIVLAGLEWLVVAVSGWFVLYAATATPSFDAARAAALAAAMATLTIALTVAAGGYSLRSLVGPRRGIPFAIAGFAASAVILLDFSSGTAHSGLFTGAVIVSAGVLVPFRLGAGAAVRWAVDSGLTARRAVLAGGGAETERLVRGLAAAPANDIRICGLFDDRTSSRVPDLVLNVPRIGRFDDLVAFCRIAEIDLIILCLPPEADRRIAQLLEQFRVLPVQVHLSAFNRGFEFPRAPGSGLLDASFRAERRLMKRGFDLLFGSILLTLFAPLMLMI
ncbi:MAG: sugar transferase, partial [Tropicimonas sp.]